MSRSLQVRDADKRAALEEVLGSTTFLRASQVRNFLRYICEMELAGRGASLHEYLIGVEALGRPTAYSTEDDSSVRRRAYALRQKLDEVYAKELTTARVRIDVPKGSYVPRFIPVDRPEPRHAGCSALQA
ncbi:MAG TPA: hypothetical protein VD833_22835 [Vicinamibacterales bacterium]|nr:hypothetical protein [Vicinamibacterales bacterium]